MDTKLYWYTIFYWDLKEDPGETTLWAHSEEEAEERFYKTHRKSTPFKAGYDIRKIMKGEEV